MKQILFLLTFIIIIGTLGLVNAETYIPHSQNKQLNFSITSNFATNCTLQNMNTPNGVVTLNQLDTGFGAFDFSIDGSNFNSIGTYCMNIFCTDGTSTTTGTECREVTPSGFIGTLGFYFVIIILLALLIFMGFYISEEWFVILGGLGLMMLGIYSINNGIAGFKDMFMTWGVGLFEIGVGFILAIKSTFELFKD